MSDGVDAQAARAARFLALPAPTGTLVESARELREQGTYGYLERTKVGVDAVRAAFGR